MKTYTDIFGTACSFESLLAGFYRARRGKGGREEVARFGYRLETHLLQLEKELLEGTYVHGAYRKFTVHDSKRRQIQAAPFRDRIVHQAICATLEPVFERRFIFDSYACRRGKGTHAALLRFERFMRVSRYALSLDISKYFASIDHAVLLSRLAHIVSDPRMLRLCALVIESGARAPGRGIPIGNLTSQLFANIYLDVLDQYIKHPLGLHRYIRYMDDMVILHDDKQLLHEVKEKIRLFVEDTLKLTLHPYKVQVAPTMRGIDFLGYRVFPRYRLLRKSTVKRFVARTKCQIAAGGASENSVRSWLGYASYARSYGLRRALSTRLKEPLLFNNN